MRFGKSDFRTHIIQVARSSHFEPVLANNVNRNYKLRQLMALSGRVPGGGTTTARRQAGAGTLALATGFNGSIEALRRKAMSGPEGTEFIPVQRRANAGAVRSSLHGIQTMSGRNLTEPPCQSPFVKVSGLKAVQSAHFSTYRLAIHGYFSGQHHFAACCDVQCCVLLRRVSTTVPYVASFLSIAVAIGSCLG